MEMSHQGGVEAESLLRRDQKNGAAVVKPYGFTYGHVGGAGEAPEKQPFLRNEPVRLTPAWEGSNLPNDTLNLKGFTYGHVGGAGEAPEKQPFLRNEPVRLTPAWEGSNLPNDTLNLKGVGMELSPPKDRWRLIYMTMVLHGLGTLTAWNMFITAKDYFEKYKLGSTPELAGEFLSSLSLASQVPNLLFSWFNVFVRIGGDLTTRIVWSLSMEVLVFVFTVIMAMVDSTGWEKCFFWATIASVIILNTFNSIFQNTVYGVAARLPGQYTGAVVLGSNISGTLTVLIQWASEGFTGSSRTSAVYYFIGGMLILLACFDTYFALPLNRFFRYHETMALRTARNPTLEASSQSTASKRPPYWSIIKQCWLQLFNVFFVFFVSLAVFPVVHSDVKKSENSNLEFLGSNFTRVTCFLTFNLTAMLGNISASVFTWPGPRLLTVFTVVRIVFIPFFLLCNYFPATLTRTLVVLVKDDALYWVMSALLGWSSGHGSSLAMMYVSRPVAPEHAATAGMMGAASLVTGLVAGLTFSRVCPIIVTSDLWST